MGTTGLWAEAEFPATATGELHIPAIDPVPAYSNQPIDAAQMRDYIRWVFFVWPRNSWVPATVQATAAGDNNLGLTLN